MAGEIDGSSKKKTKREEERFKINVRGRAASRWHGFVALFPGKQRLASGFTEIVARLSFPAAPWANSECSGRELEPSVRAPVTRLYAAGHGGANRER